MPTVRCKTCHYSLAKLTEHRCPECGNEFDPSDPSTFFPEKLKPEIGRQALSVTAVIGYLIAFLLVLPNARDSLNRWNASTAEYLRTVAFSSLFLWPFIFGLLVGSWFLVKKAFTALRYMRARRRGG